MNRKFLFMRVREKRVHVVDINFSLNLLHELTFRLITGFMQPRAHVPNRRETARHIWPGLAGIALNPGPSRARAVVIYMAGPSPQMQEGPKGPSWWMVGELPEMAETSSGLKV